MNMLTKVAHVYADSSVINKEIKKYEEEGWYLRGTPIAVGNLCNVLLTFEKPDTSDSKGEERKPDVPPPDPEKIRELMYKNKADDK